MAVRNIGPYSAIPKELTEPQGSASKVSHRAAYDRAGLRWDHIVDGKDAQMLRIGRRRFCLAAATAPLVAGASISREEREILAGGHKRAGDKLIVRGQLVKGMLAVPVALGSQPPILFEVATVARGFVLRSEVAEHLGVKSGDTARSLSTTVADLPVALESELRVLPSGWPLPQPLAGVMCLDAFGPLSAGLNFPAAELLLAPVSLPPPDGRTVLGFSDPLHPTVPVSVGDVTFEAVVGTGQIRSPLLIVPEIAARIVTDQIDDGEAFDGKRMVKVKKGRLVAPPRVGATALSFAIAVSPPPDTFNNLGAPALQNAALYIDQRNKRIQIVTS